MMLHECYMSGKHITWFNPFAQRQLSHIMLEGYMFLMTMRGIGDRRFQMPYGEIDYLPQPFMTSCFIRLTRSWCLSLAIRCMNCV